MNWYHENRWLGNFLIAFALSIVLALWLLFRAKNAFADASAEFNRVATERSRLERLNPFPNEDNFRKTEAALENYGASLNKIKEELQKDVVPATPLAPNEFQSRLRQTILHTTERARANRVKLPDNFYLGFDEYTAALPRSDEEAKRLGQELGQIEMLTNILIDARIDAIIALKRPSPSAEPGSSPAPQKPGAAVAPVVERAIIDLTFSASPSAMGKVLNQIASSEHQFFIVRALNVRNEQQKGPSREAAGKTAGTTTATAASSPSAIKFIVGNEHVETSAKVELVRFAF
jgi:hypothetical protein